MNVLVSNDDGINASGIRHLIEALRGVEGVKIYVCAPDGQRSASGHSISTTGGPIIVHDVEIPGVEKALSLSGTPADCVKSGIKMLRNNENIQIDVVFAGINHGSNIGTDVYYSGTVSAAIEGTFNKVPAVSISVGTHYPTEEQLANCTEMIQDLCKRVVPELDYSTVLNVNFPNVPPAEIKGLKICRLGPREYDEQFDIMTNPRGEKYYWYTGELVEYKGLPEDYDVMAHQEGYVTLTPLRMDITDFSLMETAQKWNLKY